MTNSDSGWVEPRLADEEAEQLDELLSRLLAERAAQFDRQGMSNTPAAYESLTSDNPRQYLRERYMDGDE